MSINRDLQATHRIISAFESSKASLENILDQLPDSFAIVNRDLDILKGNNALAGILGLDIELILGKNLQSLFQAETLRIFQSNFEQVTKSGKPQVNFELPLDRNGDVDKFYYWSILPLPGAASKDYFCVSGRDISQLRNYEKQLNEIFASIPVAILTVDDIGVMRSPVSAYAHWLFDTTEIVGHSLQALIFKRSWEYFSEGEKKAIEVLSRLTDYPASAFAKLEAELPKRMYYPMAAGSSNQERYLGFRYQPVVYGEKIKSILVMIEDLSPWATAEEKLSLRKHLK